jgi:hypothetical protein
LAGKADDSSISNGGWSVLFEPQSADSQLCLSPPSRVRIGTLTSVCDIAISIEGYDLMRYVVGVGLPNLDSEQLIAATLSQLHVVGKKNQCAHRD